MFTRVLRIGLLAAAVSLGSGCDDGPSESVFDPQGTVRFTYTGAASGNFEATGVLSPEGTSAPQPVTGARAYVQDGVLSILAFRVTAGTTGDGFVLLLGGVSDEGSVQLNPLACSEQSLDACRAGVFARNVDAAALSAQPDLDAVAANAYVLAIGSVRVTGYTSTRVKGTFSGTAVPASGFGGQPSARQVANLLTISDGRFDVPVQPE